MLLKYIYVYIYICTYIYTGRHVYIYLYEGVYRYVYVYLSSLSSGTVSLTVVEHKTPGDRGDFGV